MQKRRLRQYVALVDDVPTIAIIHICTIRSVTPPYGAIITARLLHKKEDGNTTRDGFGQLRRNVSIGTLVRATTASITYHPRWGGIIKQGI